MKDEYIYGEDFELDEVRVNRNISKMLKGKTKSKRKKKTNLSQKFTAWRTP